MLPENIREFMTVRWALALAVVALVAFTGGVFYSYITDPGIIADDGSGDDLMDESDGGSQGQTNEDESTVEDSAVPPGYPEGTVLNTVTIDGETVEEIILPPGFTHTAPPNLLELLNTLKPDTSSLDETESIVTYSSGPETAGSKIYLPDGRTIQLPDDAFIRSAPSAVSCFVGEKCPVMPVYAIERGDATITVEGNGVVSFSSDDARGSSTPEDFDFLKHLITDPNELWSANTGASELVTSTPTLPE